MEISDTIWGFYDVIRLVKSLIWNNAYPKGLSSSISREISALNWKPHEPNWVKLKQSSAQGSSYSPVLCSLTFGRFIITYLGIYCCQPKEAGSLKSSLGLYLATKGQWISKGLVGVFNSSKNRRKKSKKST